MSDALTRIAEAAIQNQRAVLVNWPQRNSDGEPFPEMKIAIDGDTWTLFFSRGATGWLFKSACTSRQEHRGLGRLLAAIENDTWQEAAA